MMQDRNSLKWILVTSFGYLGFNNAKFGRIDAHIAVALAITTINGIETLFYSVIKKFSTPCMGDSIS
jgi:hypothetical protein